MKINLIIASYGGLPKKHAGNNLKKEYLKINLQCLNQIKSNISKITIMKPKIKPEDTLLPNYYDFSNLNLSNIKDKIEVIQCENIGISYGQFFSAMLHSGNEYFDYTFWIEDDYIICADYFEKMLISILHSNENYNNVHICPFIYKNKKWDIVPYARFIGETSENISELEKKLSQYNASDLSCHIPDLMQLGIFPKNVVQKMKMHFGSFENIIEFFNIPFTKIWLHQILFGYVLNLSGVEIKDTADTIMNIFYETSVDKIFLCNYSENVNTWKERTFNNDLFCVPHILPLEIVMQPDKYKDDLELMIRYVSTPESFYTIFNTFKKNVADYIVRLNSQFVLREIQPSDYYHGYLDLMYEFTNYEYSVSENDFKSYLSSQKDHVKIVVVFSKKEGKIIGAGSLFCIRKLHNNPVCQIEDFIITKDYRNKGIGRMILQKLISFAKEDFKCYKIILKSNQENFDFYEKIGFSPAGVEMKYSN